MQRISLCFEFSQRFDVAAAAVYAWSTDFRAQDIELMGKRGRRRVTRVCNDTLVLTDTFLTEDGGRVTKRKLVKLYPERLEWTNTHLTGPNRHSQFLYRVAPEGKRRSRLDFTGRQLESVASATPKEARALARKIAREDAGTWKTLARALAAELRRA